MKKLFSPLLCAAIIAAFCSCGENVSPNESTTGTSEITESGTGTADTQAPDSYGSETAETSSAALTDALPPDTTETEPESTMPATDEYVKSPDEYFDIVINYTKPIKQFYDDMPVEDLSIKEHVVRIPELIGSTDAVFNLNEKLLEKYFPIHEILENDEEKERIYLVDCRYTVFCGYAEIQMTYSEGVQFGGIGSSVEIYYFDLESDREVTLDEFLEHFDLSRKLWEDKFMESEDCKQLREEGFYEFDSVRLNCAFVCGNLEEGTAEMYLDLLCNGEVQGTYYYFT